MSLIFDRVNAVPSYFVTAGPNSEIYSRFFFKTVAVALAGNSSYSGSKVFSTLCILHYYLQQASVNDSRYVVVKVIAQ